MNIEIKNVKYAAFNSEETHCFSATVYKDGKAWCTVRNEGHGGPDDFNPVKGNDYKALYKEIKEFEKTLPQRECSWNDKKTGKPCMMDSNLEIVIGDLMNEWLIVSDVKKLLKKPTAFKPNKDIVQWKGKPDVAFLDAITKKFPDYIIMNRLALSEAVTLYKEAN